MKYIVLFIMLLGCGNYSGSATKWDSACVKGLMLATNCTSVDTSLPADPAPTPLTLSVTGVAGEVSPTNVAVKIGNLAWAPVPTASIPTTLIAPGQCITINVRAKIGNKTRYLSNSGNFELCDDNDNVLVNVNTDNDSLFDDYTITIAASGNIYYETIGNVSYICREE